MEMSVHLCSRTKTGNLATRTPQKGAQGIAHLNAFIGLKLQT